MYSLNNWGFCLLKKRARVFTSHHLLFQHPKTAINLTRFRLLWSLDSEMSEDTIATSGCAAVLRHYSEIQFSILASRHLITIFFVFWNLCMILKNMFDDGVFVKLNSSAGAAVPRFTAKPHSNNFISCDTGVHLNLHGFLPHCFPPFFFLLNRNPALLFWLMLSPETCNSVFSGFLNSFFCLISLFEISCFFCAFFV